MKPLHVVGMHGMGDCLHQRAIVRELAKTREVWLETPWPCLYHDMPELRLIGKSSRLRTQAKNAARERSRYFAEAAPVDADMMTVAYAPAAVMECGSVLAAMCRGCGVPVADFRLPIPPTWAARADELIATLNIDKPILIYRPLVERTEWSGGRNRNPEPPAYVALLRSIRERFFVISVADLVDGIEWTTSDDIGADVVFHRGELDVELLAALVARAALVMSAPGFAVILAQSVGTPSVVVFGGYEDGRSFSAGAHLTPTLAIQPVRPCPCWSHHHRCDKRIDMTSALLRLKEFAHAASSADQPVAA